jgi:hypothetical protein
MLSIIQNIPDIRMYPLKYVFDKMQLQHKPGTLWLEFGVGEGITINYISSYTLDKVYGFDSFYGLPEKWRDCFDKGMFNRNGKPPKVNNNVEIVKGLFCDTLENFLKTKNQKISFIHIDSDLYSSAKCVLDNVKTYLDVDCMIIFDEFVNYPQFDSDTCELKAFYDFITENEVKYSWIGMNGTLGMEGYYHENVAVMIHSVKTKI